MVNITFVSQKWCFVNMKKREMDVEHLQSKSYLTFMDF